MTARSAIGRASCSGLPLAVLLMGALSAAQEPPRFTSGIEAVRVDVLVTDRGRPVTGLTASDFEVRDNGVLQQATLVGLERLQLNVVLVLDLSWSVRGERLEDLQRACRALLTQLRSEDRAAILGFSHAILPGSRLTQDRAQLLSVLNDAKPAGNTALVDATFAGMIVGESEPGRVLVMVFSDGLDVSSWLSPSRVVDVALQSETVVYGVSMKGSRPAFLDQLTTQTGGRLLDVDSRRLSATFLDVLNEFRERYLITYSPRGVAREGWHAIDVRVKARKVTVKARPGYLASPR